MALSDPEASSIAARREAKVLDDDSFEDAVSEEVGVEVEIFAVLLYSEDSRLDKLEMLDISHPSFKIKFNLLLLSGCNI